MKNGGRTNVMDSCFLILRLRAFGFPVYPYFFAQAMIFSRTAGLIFPSGGTDSAREAVETETPHSTAMVFSDTVPDEISAIVNPFFPIEQSIALNYKRRLNFCQELISKIEEKSGNFMIRGAKDEGFEKLGEMKKRTDIPGI